MNPVVNIAAILAGGTGSRMGSDCPKQYLQLGHQSIIAHAIQAFEANNNIQAIIIVTHADWIEHVKTLCQQAGFHKVAAVVEGGKERYLSSLQAIHAAQRWTTQFGYAESSLWIHDAARPLVSQRILNQIAESLLTHEAVAVGMPAVDTIWQTTSTQGGATIQSIPDRSLMVMAQTPQAFRLTLLHQAYLEAMKPGEPMPTDDCSVWLRYQHQLPIHIVEGERSNLKITAPVDLVIAQSLIQQEKE